MGRDDRFRTMQARRDQSASAQQAERRRAQQTHAPGLLDRFGVEIKANDLVLYRPPFDLVFKVEQVTPILDPRVPPGSVTILLSCVNPVHVTGGQPLANFVVVGMAEDPAGSSTTDPPPAPEADAPAETPGSAIQLTD